MSSSLPGLAKYLLQLDYLGLQPIKSMQITYSQFTNDMQWFSANNPKIICSYDTWLPRYLCLNNNQKEFCEYLSYLRSYSPLSAGILFSSKL